MNNNDETGTDAHGAADRASPPPSESEPVLSLINKIKDRAIEPQHLSADDRRRCVEVLRSEGYGIAEIGQILRRNERTIYRDLEEIRSTYALAPDAHLAERLIGELRHHAETSMARLRRIARESNASAMERQMAEVAAWRVFTEYFELLQSVGYVPRVPASVVADVYQHLQADAIAGYDQLAERLRELERIEAVTSAVDPRRAIQRRMLLEEVERGRLAAKIDQLMNPDIPMDGAEWHDADPAPATEPADRASSN
ncbi:MAG: helix-turn-helix domain-containing protein [Phycisphaerae bacterium]|nr:helix-turn-helix domain-containing protein [Phycisphaerae bacterium]